MEEKETPKNRFESEMTRMMELVILRITGIDSRLGNIENDVSELKQEVKSSNRKLDILSAQFNDVAVMAIKDNQRISKLEIDVADLQSNIH